jgi:hypothetical protein
MRKIGGCLKKTMFPLLHTLSFFLRQKHQKFRLIFGENIIKIGTLTLGFSKAGEFIFENGFIFTYSFF